MPWLRGYRVKAAWLAVSLLLLTALGEGQKNPKGPAVKRDEEDWSGSRY
jgi:hypothetical protein